MKFSCEQCGTRYSIADQKVEGKRLRIRCKVCNFIMDVRGTPKHLIQAKVSRSETTVQAAPEMPPRADWYAAKGGEPIGPVTFSALANEIKERRLPRDVLVWNETFSDWKSAADVPELARLLPPPVPVPPTPTPDSPMDDAAIDAQGAPLADTATEPAQYESAGEDASVGHVDTDAVPKAVAQPIAEPLSDGPIDEIADLSLSDVEPLSMSGQFDLGADDSVSEDVAPASAEVFAESVSNDDEGSVDEASDSNVQEEPVSSFSRDNTEMFSLEEIENMSADKSDADASVSDDVEAPPSQTEGVADVEEDISGAEDAPASIDVALETESETEPEATSEPESEPEPQAEPVESLETAESDLSGPSETSLDEQDSSLGAVDGDASASIDHNESSSDGNKGSDDGETPVWLGTDDGLPQFVVPTDTVPLSTSPTEENEYDDELEDATLPPTDNEALVVSEAIETQADVEEPTVDISTDPFDPAEASGGEVLLRPTEPGVASAEAGTPFVTPATPQQPKTKGSSKSMPAVLIAVVGIVLVTFLVLRDDSYGPISPEPTQPNSNAVVMNKKPKELPVSDKVPAVPKLEQTVTDEQKVTESGDGVTEVKPSPKTDVSAVDDPTKKPTQNLRGAEPVEPVSPESKKNNGLLAEELDKSDKTVESAQPKKEQRPKRRGGLLATSVKNQPAKTKTNKPSLLAALNADEDEDDLDVTKLGSLEGARATKDKKSGKGRADRLMNSGNQLEQFERRKMARLDQPKLGSKKNRERLLDLPSDSEIDSGSDGFPAEDVSRIFNRERKGINVCYNKHLKKGGRRFRRQLKLVFSVGPTGKASNVSIGSRYSRTVMRTCLSKFIGRLKFPPFEGRAQKVEFNLKLSNIY